MLLTLPKGVLSQVFDRLYPELHLTSCMVRILREVALARMVVLILAVLVSNVLSFVVGWVLIMVDARFLVHIIVVRVTLGIIKIEQIVMVARSLKIVATATLMIVVIVVFLVVVVHNRYVFAMASL